jgi:hypothetical protein
MVFHPSREIGVPFFGKAERKVRKHRSGSFPTEDILEECGVVLDCLSRTCSYEAG